MREFSLTPEPSEARAPEVDTIFHGLNPAQQEAVRTTEGPLLIIAGPGSGKTRVLTYRIAYLIATGKCRPWEILALTFTNKAAREMKDRILRLVGEEPARNIWMGTFHAIFARILRREATHLGYTSNFTIYDTDDTDRVLRTLMDRYNVDPKQFNVHSVRSAISSAKNHLVSPADYQRTASSPLMDKVALVYGPYLDALKAANAMDFDDLLLKPIELFESKPDVLAAYQAKWRYIHIDEYQDTNHAQYVLARQLASQFQNFCVVGDDAQSIYSFRGADIGNILSFQRDYPKATTVRLEQNYRSTGHIIRLAESIIRHNGKQLQKELWTENPDGEFVLVMEALSEKDEAEKIQRRIRDFQARFGMLYRDFAVLYRTNAQSRSIEESLRRGNIPYRVVGGTSFYQRKEIKDVLAYLRVLVNPADVANLRRIFNYPTRGIGDKTQAEIGRFAEENGLNYWEAIERVEEVGLPSRATGAVVSFREMLRRYRAEVEGGEVAPEDIVRRLITEVGIIQEFRQENTPEALVRLENVQELFNAIAEFTQQSEEGDLASFLQSVSLLTDADVREDTTVVTLMTLHASKGLEFPVVFIAGLEDGLFPSGVSNEPDQIEEERRLFYVGITRAERFLLLSYARSRFRYGVQQDMIRSSFLDEIDPSLIRTEGGKKLSQNPERLRVKPGTTSSYKDVDPFYYLKSLRPEKPASPEGRHIVYDEDEGGIVPGARVVHQTFGEGKVIALEGAGDQTNVVVHFRDIGQKKMRLRMARLQRVG